MSFMETEEVLNELLTLEVQGHFHKVPQKEVEPCPQDFHRRGIALQILYWLQARQNSGQYSVGLLIGDGFMPCILLIVTSCLP